MTTEQPAETAVIGVDIGGTGIKGAPVSLEQGALTKSRIRLLTPSPATPDAVAKTVAELLTQIESQRPRTRADCVNGARPCLFVSCKHNRYLDVNPETGSIKLNFPDKEITELEHTCALDVAEKGGITLEEVGEIMNLTRERIRQVETRGLMKLREATEAEPPASARKP